MKFLTVRELRRSIGELSAELEHDEVVLTSNGKPTALLTRVAADDLEELVKELRLARARIALRRLQRDAVARGLDRATDADINAAITEARAAKANEAA
jgi:prevent-host-death family protein